MTAYRSDSTKVHAAVYKVKDLRALLDKIDETWKNGAADEVKVDFDGKEVSVTHFTPWSE